MSFTEVMKYKDLTAPDSLEKKKDLFTRTTDLLSRLGPDPVKNIETILDGALTLMGTQFTFYIDLCGTTPAVKAQANLPVGLSSDIKRTPSLFTRPLGTDTIFLQDCASDCPTKAPDPVAEKYGINALAGVSVIMDRTPLGTLWVGASNALEFTPSHPNALRCLAVALGQQLLLEQAATHRRITEMAAQTAHDLNNILSGLVSYPELILMQLEKDNPLQEPVAFIHESGLLASDLVQDFLFLARPRSYTPPPIDPRPVARDYFSGSTHAALKSAYPCVRFILNAEEKPSSVMISELFLTRIMAILVAHAAHSVRPGGRVRLHLDNSSSDRVRIVVSDDGPPIPGDDLARIFEPFYTRKKMRRPGSGLGFAVVKKIVKDHGGKITVTSSDEKGNIAEIYFPVCPTL